MKKKSYIVAVACIMAGALGLTGMYVMERSQQGQEELAKEEQQTKIEIEEVAFDNQIQEQQISQEKTIENTVSENKNSVAKSDVKTEKKEEKELDTPVEIINEEALHFDLQKADIVWPIEGTVLLDYSNDATIYFPTLQQYQYNPAMIIAGEVNSKVYFVAKGKITNIETNEVTGCTVTQELGDGYTLKYGQLKELNFKVGDIVQSGQVVGYVSEPTKYYSVEGPNVYFQVLKDNEPIDPQELLDKANSK